MRIKFAIVIKRDITYALKRAASKKMLVVSGSRSAGKASVLRAVFPDVPYFSLEVPAVRQQCCNNISAFLQQYCNGLILDGVQRVPELYPYLPEWLERSQNSGPLVLAGSIDFTKRHSIFNDLGQQIAFLSVPALTLAEIYHMADDVPDDHTVLFNGFFPGVLTDGISARDWHINYRRNYIYNDIRHIRGITEMLRFEYFMKLLAGRIGDELSLPYLAVELGVDIKTILYWIDALEHTYMIYLLRPHGANTLTSANRRPILYFQDTGVVCSLLGMNNASELSGNHIRRNLLENLVIAELLKQQANAGLPDQLYYQRSKPSDPIEVVLETPHGLQPIDIHQWAAKEEGCCQQLMHWPQLLPVSTRQALPQSPAETTARRSQKVIRKVALRNPTPLPIVGGA